ncbi:putative membrane protein [Chlamydia psittaci 06-1683]|nr:putative membrane protein [Chlamydia psittaci 06-1683]
MIYIAENHSSFLLILNNLCCILFAGYCFPSKLTTDASIH